MAREPAEIVEVEITKYKNLQDVRVAWRPRVVLYGPNGSGKTNLLEALALALGSRATLWQLAHRAVTPEAGSVAVLLRVTDWDLPTPPADSLPWLRSSNLATDPLRPIVLSGEFWSALDVERGATWSDAWHSGVVDVRLARLLAEVAARPLIRYRLERLSGLDDAQRSDRAGWADNLGADVDPADVDPADVDPADVVFERSFSRCLALEQEPEGWLVDLAPSLPGPFAPLRRWLAESEVRRSPFPDLLELPPVHSAPVRAIWLSSERTGDEAWFDLWEAYEAATRSAEELRAALGHLGAAGDEDHDEGDVEGDARWWLTVTATQAITSVLSRSMPHLSADRDELASTWLSSRDHPAGPERGCGTLSDPALFRGLSSGERTWVDIAMAHAAAVLEGLRTTTSWITLGLQYLPPEASEQVVDGLAERIEAFAEGFWNAGDFDKAIGYLSGVIGGPQQAISAAAADSPGQERVAEELWTSLKPGLREALRATTIAHFYDEPERHLHPSAQRMVADTLGDGAFAEQLTIATHSHLFLGASGWLHLHTGQTPEGPVVEPFDFYQLTVFNDLSRRMGLTRGELLGRVRYYLFVEGPVDAIVLENLYGPTLTDNGIVVLPIWGIYQARSLAELRLIGRLVDAGAGVLADNVRRGKLKQPAPPGKGTPEEDALHDLRRVLKDRGRDLDLFGLQEKDIFVYLPDSALQAVIPAFPGWAAVKQARRREEI